MPMFPHWSWLTLLSLWCPPVGFLGCKYWFIWKQTKTKCALYVVYIISFQITVWTTNIEVTAHKCTQGSSTPAVDCVNKAADWDTTLQLISNKWVCVWTLRKWAVLTEPDLVSEPPRSTFISPPAHTRSTARQHWQHPAAPKGTVRLCVPVAMIF